jgi:hypothetical protein
MTPNGTNGFSMAWNTETNVTYQVQQTSAIAAEPVTWSSASDWIVDPADRATVPLEDTASQVFFRVMLPNTDY